MGRISQQMTDDTISLTDELSGVDSSTRGSAKFPLSGLNTFFAQNIGAELVTAGNDAAAATANVPVGRLYVTADGIVRVRIS